MVEETSEPSEQIITFKGRDIRELDRDALIEAMREIYPDVMGLRNRLSDEGRMEAAREEDFQRELRGRRDFFGSAAEYQSRMFDASSAYNQIIVIGGYAAFFSVWSAFAKDINQQITLASGALITVSLVVYVTWTVMSMFQLARRTMEAVGTFTLGVEGFAERIQDVEAGAQQRSAKLIKFWKPVVYVSGATAFLAAAMLAATALWTLAFPSTVQSNEPASTVLQQIKGAAAKAECSARTAALYAQSRSGVGKTATNPITSDHAILLNGKWIVLPKC